MQDFFMQSEYGCIHCCQWLPACEPVGIVQIIHGICDYTARYSELAEFLADRGYVVVGEDHPGHGKSVGEGERYGYLTGGWMGTVKLIHRLYMLGHSMGSFLLRTYLYTYHTDLAGAILSGTCWQPEAIIPFARVLCKEEALRLGETAHSPVIQNLAFGVYNQSFAPNRTPYDWVCAREEVVDVYATDPFCTWLPSIQLCAEMMLGIQMNQKKSNLSRMRKDLPVYFFSGQLDPVGDMGNGVLKAVQAFKNAGMKDVFVELYPCMRHECHNQAEREKVFGDIFLWIESRFR